MKTPRRLMYLAVICLLPQILYADGKPIVVIESAQMRPGDNLYGYRLSS
jgi:hypothetical protein